MLITIDTDKDSRATVTSAIGFLIHLYQLDPDSGFIEVPEGTNAPKVPTAPNAATVAATATNVAPAAANVSATPNTPAPAIASNVVNFPVPPPPPPVFDSSAGTAASAQANPSANATSAAAATGVASVPAAPGAVAPTSSQTAIAVEYDSAGMPWDARIHQKAKGKKKDLTWKLIKGIDPAVVQTVTAELMARKIATPQSPSAAAPALQPAAPNAIAVTNVPPPPPAVGAVPPPPATVAPQVFLPDANDAGQQNSVPVPPVSGAAPATSVPTPNGPSTPSVPVPPSAPAGAVGGITYRSIIDKMTAGTKAGTLTAAKVLEIAQSCGCPNLQQLNQMPAIFADVDAKIDLALAGLL